MPYLWLKPEEAEIIKRRRRADIPKETADYDTQTGEYVCDDCHLPLTEIKAYTVSYGKCLVILQCQECGRTFFGDIVDIVSDERPAIKAKTHEEHREQSPKQEEEYIILPSIMTVS